MTGRKHLAALALLFLALTLACGSFAPRPGDPLPPLPTYTPTRAGITTPTPSLSAQPISPNPTAVPAPDQNSATATPAPAAATPPAPTATATPPGDIALGQPARIVARTGVNIRQQPDAAAGRNGYFASGILVTVSGGPVYAGNFIWWQVDDGHGKSGWVAGGDGEDLWLTGDIGEPRPVNRAVRLGDTVTVSVSPGKSLTVRYEPGSRGFVARRIVPGTILGIIDGPVVLDGLRWWKILRDDGLSGWAAEGDSRDRWLSPME